MKVIVDTCIWSTALRRKKSTKEDSQPVLIDLIEDQRVEIIGPIRQEILSGIKDEHDFKKLKQRLHYFPDLALSSEHYETAAQLFNLCRSNGIQGSNTDFLICATALLHKMLIYTHDKDFHHFSKVIPIKLFQPN